MWQVLIGLYFLFGTASYLLRRELAVQLGEHNRSINAFFFVTFLLPAAIVMGFLFPHDLRVGWTNLLLLLGGSVIWPIFYLTAFRANEEADTGIFAVIGNLSPLFTLAIAMPFLGERLNGVQLLGAGLLVFSGAIASASQLRATGRTSGKGLLLCFVSAAVLGIAIAYERFMLNRVDFGAYIIYGWGAQIAWAVGIAWRELKNLPWLLRESGAGKKLIAWGGASVLRSIAFIAALKTSSASLVGAASDFLSIAVVVGAYFYLKEREHAAYKIVAATVGVVGLLLITQ